MVDANKIKHVVVLAYNGIGDCFLLIPLLKALDLVLCRNTRITVVVRTKLNAEVFRYYQFTHQIICEVVSVIGFRNKIKAFFQPLFEKKNVDLLITCKRGSNNILNLLYYSFWKAGITVLYSDNYMNRIVGKFKVVMNRLYPSEGVKRETRVEFNLRIVKELFGKTAESTSYVVDENITDELLSEIASQDLCIAFGPGSGEVEKHKRWPLHNYNLLARQLIENYGGVKFLLYGGPGDRRFFEHFEYEVQQRMDVCCVADYGEVFRSLRRCKCAIAADAGPAHIAIAAGVKTIVVFCPTDATVLWPQDEEKILVGTELSCSPCYTAGFLKGCGVFDCMRTVKPDKVFDAINKVIQGQTPKTNPPLKIKNIRKPSRSEIQMVGESE